ncbi:MAG: hypothetical protein M3Q24_00685 [bacterium]|nr:hypothetical protein [bacterium]
MTLSFEKGGESVEKSKIEEKRKELLDIIHLYYASIEGFEFLSKQALDFKSKYPNCYDYVLFHDLIGSTPPPGVNNFDMPNHEIERMIIDLPESLRKAA